MSTGNVKHVKVKVLLRQKPIKNVETKIHVRRLVLVISNVWISLMQKSEGLVFPFYDTLH